MKLLAITCMKYKTSEKIRMNSIAYYYAHKNEICHKKRQFRNEHLEQVRALDKKRYYKNREKRRLQQKSGYQKNREKILLKVKEYQRRKREKVLERHLR